MLDAMIPAAAAAASAAGGTLAAMLAAAATAGEAGVEATMGMGAEAGRSSYLRTGRGAPNRARPRR